MIYVMSDLHGCYKAYKKMLDLIHFNDQDTLYVLGDVVDRGNESMKILKDMMLRFNVFPILGNHDYVAYTLLSKGYVIDKDHNEELINENLIEQFRAWILDGGKTTIAEFQKLNDEDKQDILDYFSEFSLYEEIHVNNKDYILVHADLCNFNENRDIDDYDLNELIFTRIDYNTQYFKDKIIITGHTPTFMIDEMYDGKIYKNKNHIGIDCGISYGKKLGCICLDTMEEFYVCEES